MIFLRVTDCDLILRRKKNRLVIKMSIIAFEQFIRIRRQCLLDVNDILNKLEKIND